MKNLLSFFILLATMAIFSAALAEVCYPVQGGRICIPDYRAAEYKRNRERLQAERQRFRETYEEYRKSPRKERTRIARNLAEKEQQQKEREKERDKACRICDQVNTRCADPNKIKPADDSQYAQMVAEMRRRNAIACRQRYEERCKKCRET